MLERYVLIYLTLINLVGIGFYGFDKLRAIKRKWRVRESVLIGIALVGGGIGCLMGMILFRHKLSKTAFRIWIPFSISVYWGVAFYKIWINTKF